MVGSEPKAQTSQTRGTDNRPKMPGPDVLAGFSPADLKLLRRALVDPIEYIPNPVLESPDAERLLLRPLPRAAEGAGVSGVAAGNDDSGVHALLPEDETIPVALDHERFMFLRLNYLRRRLAQVLAQHRGRRLTAEAAREVIRWQRQIHELRNEIVQENMPLVLAMARRTRINGVDPADLISEGSLALLRAVNKFDCSRGYRFSTYACRAILKSFSRVATRTARRRGRFPTEFDPELEKSDFIERRRDAVEVNCVEELRTLLEEGVGQLTEVERQVIRARFALDQTSVDGRVKGKTLEEVGELIGVTKERVRQIQNKALEKLRVLLDEHVLA